MSEHPPFERPREFSPAELAAVDHAALIMSRFLARVVPIGSIRSSVLTTLLANNLVETLEHLGAIEEPGERDRQLGILRREFTFTLERMSALLNTAPAQARQTYEFLGDAIPTPQPSAPATAPDRAPVEETREERESRLLEICAASISQLFETNGINMRIATGALATLLAQACAVVVKDNDPPSEEARADFLAWFANFGRQLVQIATATRETVDTVHNETREAGQLPDLATMPTKGRVQ